MTDRETHTCNRPGCEKVIALALFACGPHWFQLPLEHRSRIAKAYIAYRTEPHVAAESLLHAQDAAIAWWGET